ncbi:hypothetical protein EJB05_54748, partial [Eragrostis curvula]
MDHTHPFAKTHSDAVPYYETNLPTQLQPSDWQCCPSQPTISGSSPYETFDIHYCHSTIGRAVPSGAYKVVRLRDAWSAEGDSQICQIATLEEDDDEQPTWRQRPEPPVLTCWCSGCTATVNGVLYFMDRGGGRYGYYKHPGPSGWNHIASFDLESEEWRLMINCPPPIRHAKKEDSWEITLAELKGALCMVQTVRARECYTNIWRLVDSQRSVWVKEGSIPMTQSWGFLKALEIFEDGRILMLSAFDKEEEQRSARSCVLQLYDPSKETLTDVMEMTEEFRGPLTLYPGSLLS